MPEYETKYVSLFTI